MFNSLIELDNYLEENSISIFEVPSVCDVCSLPLMEYDGCTSYIKLNEYNDYKFCSDECAKNFLIKEVGIK